MKFSLKQTSNPLIEKLKEDKVLVGTWINMIRDPLIARIVAGAGFDYVFIDMEHSSITENILSDMCLIARDYGIAPIVRPVNPYNLQQNGRLLDIGATGMIIPHVNNKEQTNTIAASTRFFNSGTRGYCGKTANSCFDKNSEEYLKRSDNDVVLVAQFEDSAAIAQADEILSVPGIRMAIVGRGDLAHSMGLAGKLNDPKVIVEVEKVIAACKRTNVAPGLLCNSIEEAKEWIAKGIRFITYSNEIALLQDGYDKVLKVLKS